MFKRSSSRRKKRYRAEARTYPQKRRAGEKEQMRLRPLASSNTERLPTEGADACHERWAVRQKPNERRVEVTSGRRTTKQGRRAGTRGRSKAEKAVDKESLAEKETAETWRRWGMELRMSVEEDSGQIKEHEQKLLRCWQVLGGSTANGGQCVSRTVKEEENGKRFDGIWKILRR